ncbi:DEAD/DEAH box helicase family protein [Wielerella bovis]|uniref:DEAD/DEAH box helicase n=1 Tax=Wielerella bovis TaxID=2917790 RepID=UPI002019B440|nr:DEAD/DEAH box helicase family protein [Wielerella bovis]ULJ68942.1 DEAD/DEAH box helicase family protein [Wielerella bovis]
MELKKYQQTVIDDLQAYLNVLLAHSGSLKSSFAEYWQNHACTPLAADKIEPYHDKLNGAPNVCVKVPTAGGKTFIAVNALQPIFVAREYFGAQEPRMVVWLVPSESILSQTLANLGNLQHPYRQKLNVDFSGRVSVLDKEKVLRGHEFDADSVRHGVSILVMTFDSLKGRSKDVLRAYRENPNLSSFADFRQPENELAEYDNTSLINVLRGLKPVVIVDESHNATTTLSQEMLANLNPSFVLELTATPHEKSNIISYVGALELKKEQMVKLPLMISQQRNQADVMMAAMTLRHNLEIAATNSGQAFIRPIVLFQAEPRSKDDKATFDKVKQELLNLGIPENQIAMKTSEINELKNVDLMSPDCAIRFVITVNALKEGWDCPFAYILASLANKSSVVDVTQIVGRVLRQPYARNHVLPELNCSYVFTSSEKFHETLANVAKGLNAAGFSEQDYRIAQETENETENDFRQPETVVQPELSLSAPEMPSEPCVDDENWRIPNTFKLPENGMAVSSSNPIAQKMAQLQQNTAQISQAFSHTAQKTEHALPPELSGKTNMQKMRDEFVNEMMNFRLPQFVQAGFSNELFVENSEKVLFDKDNLLTSFELRKADRNIDFGNIETVLYASEIDEKGKVDFSPLKGKEKQYFADLFSQSSDESQQKMLVKKLFELADKKSFYPISDNDVREYLRDIVNTMAAAQRQHCFEHLHQYFAAIKQKIDGLAREFSEKEFKKQRDIDDIVLQPMYAFSPEILPKELAVPLSQSLYSRESKMSDFEVKMLRQILQDDGIRLRWWHRNEERKGFYINAFINHYPDFILLTENGTVILLETKGSQLDGSDSQAKIRAGLAWENAANALNDGHKYRYMMVFEQNQLDGTYSLAEALERLRHW